MRRGAFLVVLAGLIGWGASADAATPAKPAVISRPASTSNYTVGRGVPLDMIVIHDIEGTAPGALAIFANPSSQVSANYTVDYDGTIYQSVPDGDSAWHCGNHDYNHRSIGIEHSGFAAQSLYRDTEYEGSAHLVAYLCVKYGIKIDRQHIIGHAEVPDPFHPGQFGGSAHHTDPGPHWDWVKYMGLVKQYAGATPPQPTVPDYAATFSAQSAKTLTLTSGDTATVWFEFKNTGAKTWDPKSPSNLGTQQPQDRASAFFTAGNWLSKNRPTPVDKATAPGAIGRYSFVATAPSVTKTTSYHEVFKPVQDGVTWFGPEVAIDITVNPKTAPPPPPPPPPPPGTATTGDLAVTADPADASVWLSSSPDSPGLRLGTAGSTYKVAPGACYVTFTKPGWGTTTLTATVSAGQTTTLQGTLVRPRFSTFTTHAPVANVTANARAVPVVCDLDRDGTLDLVLGAKDGSVTFYKGVKAAGATASDLVVGAGVALTCASGPIKAASGDSVPAVCDWDGDGALDVLVGEADGTITLYRGDQKGGFLAGTALAIPKAAGGEAAPFPVDLQGDGALGLLVGQGDGTARYHRRVNGQLDQGTLVVDAMGQTIRIPGPVRAVAAELSKKGSLDLILGGKGEGRVYTQLPARVPAFTDAGPLASWTNGARASIASSDLLAVSLADVNGDGRLDLVLGDGTSVELYPSAALAADVDDSKKVDVRDLCRVERALGTKRGDAAYDPAADVNEDGKIDDLDRNIIVNAFGGTP